MKIYLILFIILQLSECRHVSSIANNQFTCMQQVCKQQLQNCLVDKSCQAQIKQCNENFDKFDFGGNMNDCLKQNIAVQEYITCVSQNCVYKLSQKNKIK